MEGEERFNNELSTDEENINEDNDFIDINQKIHVDRRSAKEKVTVAAVLIVAFVAVILGVTQFSSAMRKPIADLMLDNTADVNTNVVVADPVEALKQQDTDGDGLSDYDELYVYHTSPYLADSDSDGISDKQEIDTGTDPNCPGSSKCFNTDNSTANPDAAAVNPVDTTGLNVNSAVSPQTFFSGQTDPTILRSLLLQQGVPKSTLDNLTDAQLMASYQQAINGQNPVVGSTVGGQSQGTVVNQTIPAAGTADLTGVSNVSSINDLKNLSGAQIRVLMIQNGASAGILSQVTDDQLKTMFLSKLNSQAN